MKRFMVSTVGACVALVALQVSAASAASATFDGDCEVTGIATFGQPLHGPPAPNTYDFRSGDPGDGTGDGTKCSGTLNGQQVTGVPVTATVAGPGELSCAFSQDTSPGTGALTFPDGSTFPFKFEFYGVATEVFFTVSGDGGGSASGHASFLEYTPDNAEMECAGQDSADEGNTAGLTQLGFEATLSGSAPFAGTRPDSAPENTAPETTAPNTEEPASRCDRLSGKKKKQCVAIEKCKQIENAKKRNKCIQKAKGKGKGKK